MDANFFDQENLKIAVIGGGSWATALVKLMQHKGHRVHWYLRNAEAIEYIKTHRHHRSYLSSVYLDPEYLQMSDSMDEVVSQADVLIFAIPSAYFESEVSKLTVSLENKFVISAIKGFVTSEYLSIAEYFNRVCHLPFDQIGIISGPSHAEEMGMQRLSYLTLTSKHAEVAEKLCELFRCDYVNTIPGTDIYGVEYASALKNVYAVATGIAHGLGYGDNFTAVLITSAFHEMVSFLDATYPDANRITSRSAYLGDLLVTCYSQFSRNRTYGSMIGKGYSVMSAQSEMSMVAEGHYAVKSIHQINLRYSVKMPIVDAVYKILYEGCYPVRIFGNLCRLLQ